MELNGNIFWPEVKRIFMKFDKVLSDDSLNLMEFEEYVNEKSEIAGIDHKCTILQENDPSNTDVTKCSSLTMCYNMENYKYDNSLCN